MKFILKVNTLSFYKRKKEVVLLRQQTVFSIHRISTYDLEKETLKLVYIIRMYRVTFKKKYNSIKCLFF